MKNIVERLRAFFSNKTNIFILIFILLNAGLTVHVFMKTGRRSYKILAVVLVIELILEISILLFLRHLSKRNAKPEKKFLAIAIPLGLLFTFLLPVGQAPDEYMHIIRAYAISQGEIIPKTNSEGKPTVELPSGLANYAGFHKNKTYSDVIKKVNTTIDGPTYSNSEEYSATTNYNPIVYIPHSLGIFIGRGFNLPLLHTLYIGRIFSLFAYIILAYFAIKIIPKFKSFLVFASLLPMSLQQAMAFSADSITIGISFLVIAYAVYLAYNNKVKTITRKQTIGIYILTALISICKLAYAPLCLLFLIIPHKKFKTKKSKWLIFITATLLAGALSIAWIKIQPTMPLSNTDNGQLSYILSKPHLYLMHIFGTIADQYTLYYVSSLFGMFLGLLHIPLPTIYLVITFVLLLLLIIRNKEIVSFQKYSRLIFWGSFIVIVGLVLTALYISWTDYQSLTIEGVQGRYFLPILPLLPFMFYSKERSAKEKRPLDQNYILLFSVFFNICALVYVFAYTL